MITRLFRPPPCLTSRLTGLTLAAGLVLSLAGPADAGLFGSDPTPPADVPMSQDAAQQAVRINDLEQQVRVLNGRMDELGHQIEQLMQMLKRAQEDNEFRLQKLEGGKGQKRSDAAPTLSAPAAPVTATADALPSPTTEAGLEPGFAIDAPGTVGAPATTDPALGAPPTTLGTLPGSLADAGAPSASAVGGPLDLSAVARGDVAVDPSITTSGGLAAGVSQDLASGGVLAAPQTAGALPAPVASAELSGASSPVLDPGADYDRAYSAILGGDYASAEAGFKKFLADFPGDPRAADARFWLGESYFSRQQYRDAATAFLSTYKDHPTAQKAPESLFKLGLSLEGLGEKSAACATYGEFGKKFPKVAAGLADRVTTQKQKLGCS